MPPTTSATLTWAIIDPTLRVGSSRGEADGAASILGGPIAGLVDVPERG
jgi:hypothetical protein